MPYKDRKKNKCWKCGVAIEYTAKSCQKHIPRTAVWRKRIGDKKRTQKKRLGYYHTSKGIEAMRLAGKKLIGEKNPAWKGGLPKCRDCGKKLTAYTATFCHRCQFKGDRSYSWQGGITKLNLLIRKCPQNKAWKKAVLKNDDYTCSICKKRGGKLHVDHYPVAFSEILKKFKVKSVSDAVKCEALWNTKNGRVLCVPCHKKVTTEWKKRNWKNQYAS